MHRQQVARWMTHDVVSVPPDEPLFSALERMDEARIRHLLVRERDRVVGVFSNRDVIRATLRFPDGRLHLHETSVGEVMTPAPLQTTSPEASLGECADLMLRHRISALPVYRDGELVGILTSNDVLRAASRDEHQGRRPDV